MKSDYSVTIYFILLIILSGCINPFAPSLSDQAGDENAILSDQTTTEGVFVNFSFAYNFKDSLVYSDLLDSSFIFLSKNFATTPVTDLTWGRDTDMRTTAGIFRYFETIDLIWDNESVSERFLNEDSTLKEIQKTFQLTLNGGSEYPSIRGDALFHLTKSKLNKQDTTKIWRISRWEDLATF